MRGRINKRECPVRCTPALQLFFGLGNCSHIDAKGKGILICTRSGGSTYKRYGKGGALRFGRACGYGQDGATACNGILFDFDGVFQLVACICAINEIPLALGIIVTADGNAELIAVGDHNIGCRNFHRSAICGEGGICRNGNGVAFGHAVGHVNCATFARDFLCKSGDGHGGDHQDCQCKTDYFLHGLIPFFSFVVLTKGACLHLGGDGVCAVFVGYYVVVVGINKVCGVKLECSACDDKVVAVGTIWFTLKIDYATVYGQFSTLIY